MNDVISAFVIMPFSEEFDSIYTRFIKETLEDIGFTVSRADDLVNQRNILWDIVSSIVHSDLIIADLTGENPNVYYELGIAHALNKPVIIITQDLDEIPFDLQSYRVIGYTTHFAEIDKSMSLLKEAASGLLDNSIKFGNPISDFNKQVTSEILPQTIDDSQISFHGEEGEPGFIDYLADLSDGYNDISEIVNTISSEMEKLTANTDNFTEELTTAMENQSEGTPAYLRKISRSLAHDMNEFNDLLSKSNKRYKTIAQNTQNNLEEILNFQNPETPEEFEKIQSFIDTLIQTHNSTDEAKSAYENLAKILESLPKFERHLNKAIENTIFEINSLINNIDQTLASLNRGIEVGIKRLGEV